MRAIRLVPAGIVLLALGGIAGAAQLSRPAATAATPAVPVTQQVAVTSAARACPPAQDGPGTVAFIAAPDGTTDGPAGEPGQAGLTPLSLVGAKSLASGLISEKTPGALSLLTLPGVGRKATPAGWSVTATGVMARAMEAEVAQASGLATLRCGEPGSDIWFVGPGSGNGAARVTLDLMNIDALTASVDVTVITDAGPVQAGNNNGITVPPHQMVTESLSGSGAGSAVLAVEVRTTIGRVAAAVSESPPAGTAGAASPPGGTAGTPPASTTAAPSWLPSATAPSTSLVIPGVSPSGHSAGLFLVVPGAANAKVNVLAITPQGRYRPFGSQTVELPGESASYVALAPLGGTAAALQITANVPVTASVLIPGNGVGAFATPTAPVSEQAVVAGNLTGSGFAASVVLSAPAGAARVRLTEIAAQAGAKSGAKSGPSLTASQVVTVRGGHTLVVPATAPRGSRHGSAFSLVITPLAGSGPLYAARVETQGQGTVVSIIPATSALTTISLPPARDSYDAIAPNTSP